MPDDERARGPRLLVLAAACLAAAGIIWGLGPLPQDETYHGFADARRVLGVPHFANVVSNAPFALVGAWGIVELLRPERVGFLERWERTPFLVFFAAVLLTAFGSSWYHLDPANGTLMWDRLPLSIVFSAFTTSMVAERLGGRAGRLLLWPFVAAAVASVLFWHVGELRGTGDLRLYGMVQFVPLVAIPLLLALFPGRYDRTGDLALAALGYLLAKATEYFDLEIYGALGFVSGHTFKHLFGAAAIVAVIHHLRHRRPVERVG